MLTVLVRYKKSCVEVLFSAETVQFTPKKGALPGLLITHGGAESTHLTLTPDNDENWRNVFIMNDKGQTVAKYVL